MLRDPRFGRDIRPSLPASHLDQGVYDRSYPEQYPTWLNYIRNSFIDLEPPQHTRIKNLVRRAFARRAAESFRADIEQHAQQLLDPALERGSLEVIADFATPLPLRVISEMLSIPAERQRCLLDWSHAIVRLFDQRCVSEDATAAEQATVEFVSYLEEVLAERSRQPGADLISHLLQAEVEGEHLQPQEVIATCILILNAGHEATVHAIGNGLLALAQNPASYRWLQQNRKAIPAAVEELLRYDPPLQMFERWVLAEMEVAGITFHPGQKVGLLFGAANRDPDRFAQPDQLVLDRADNPHLSFGAGIHYCLGVALARVELAAAFSVLVDKVDSLELAVDSLSRKPSLVFRGVEQLPLNLKPS